MTIAILILTALVLPLALVYLSVATNEFEKTTKTLAEFVRKRYVIAPPKQAGDGSKAMQFILKIPGKP